MKTTHLVNLLPLLALLITTPLHAIDAKDDIGTWDNIRQTRSGLYSISMCSLAELTSKYEATRIIRLVNLPRLGYPHTITLIDQQDGQTTLIFESSTGGLIQTQSPPPDKNTPTIKKLMLELAKILPWDTMEKDPSGGDDQPVIMLEYYSKDKQGYTIKNPDSLSEIVQQTLIHLSSLRPQ